jgi:glycosyltransferase involved in cell wall biosynthesis
LVKSGGIFYSFLPQGIQIKVIPYKAFTIQQRIRYFIKKHTAKLQHSQAFWSIFKANFFVINEEYDFAIAYSQGFASYFVEANMKAKMKFAWINTDYAASGYQIKFDYPIYKNFNQVVCVSGQAKESFESELNKIEKTISTVVIKDIIDVNIIKSQSSSLIEELDRDKIQIVTVGRLAKPKGIPMAIETCKILIDRGYRVEWRVVGEGSERGVLQNKINNLGLNSSFILIGAKSNPYPYMKSADIYVQTSLFEGLGLTVIEAAVLNKPIVSTSFPTVYEILKDEQTGLIADMNPNSIANKIEKLILDVNLRNKLTNNLALNRNNDKDISMQKIYTLLR